VIAPEGKRRNRMRELTENIAVVIGASKSIGAFVAGDCEAEGATNRCDHPFFHWITTPSNRYA
jgi:hypothetical protein